MRIAIAAQLTLLAGFASCGDAPPAPTSSARVPAIDLVDAGAAPRAVFARRFARGATQNVRITQSASMSVFAGGKMVPETGIPPLALDLAAAVVDFDGSTMRLRCSVTGAAIENAPWADASARQMLEQEVKLGTILGLGGFVTVGSNGVTRSTTTNMPNQASSIVRNVLGQVTQTLEQCVVPWPSAALGAGARWTIVRTLDLSGIELSEAATWTLTNFEAGLPRLRVEIDYSTLGKTVHLPGMPAQAQLELIELRGTGRGTVLVDPASPLPRDAAFDSTLDLKASASVKGEPDSIDATIHLHSILARP